MKHEYWVIFPQGIYKYRNQTDLESDDWYSFCSYLVAHSLNEANNLMEKYSGSYFEKIIYKNRRRFVVWYEVPTEYEGKNLEDIYSLNKEKYDSIKFIK